jgi:hypothetical protein
VAPKIFSFLPESKKFSYKYIQEKYLTKQKHFKLKILILQNLNLKFFKYFLFSDLNNHGYNHDKVA